MRVSNDRQLEAAGPGLHSLTGPNGQRTGAWVEKKENGSLYPFWRGSIDRKRGTVQLEGDGVAQWLKHAKLLKAQRDKGQDPRAPKASEKTPAPIAKVRAAPPASPLDVLFEEAARGFAADAARGKRRNGRNPEHEFLSSLEGYAFNLIGRKRIRDITVADVIACMISAEDGVTRNAARRHDGKTTRERLRIKIRRVIASAKALGGAEGHAHPNYADAERVHAANRAMKLKKRNVNFRRIDLDDGVAQTAYRHVAAQFAETGRPVLGAFLFGALNASRPGEARNLPWAEVNLDRRSWTLPSERSKTGVEHKVPLSDQAMAILAKMKELGLSSAVVFPGQSPDKSVSHAAFSENLSAKRLGVDIGTPHSWRSLWRDWCDEAGGIPREVAEQQLQHAIGDVEGRYRRSDLFRMRKAALQRWADWLTGREAETQAPAVITPIRGLRAMFVHAVTLEFRRRHGEISQKLIESMLEDTTLDGVTFANLEIAARSIVDQLDQSVAA